MAANKIFADFVKRNYVLLIITIVVMVASVQYANYVTKVAPDKTWDVVTSLITTVLSIVLGATLSIIIYNFQKEQQDREKVLDLKDGIRAEMNDISEVLSRESTFSLHFGNEVIPFTITYIQPTILETAANSGLFDSISTENFLHVARKIRFYNVHVSYLLNLLSNIDSPTVKQLIKSHQSNMETTRLAIIENIIHLLKLLED
jgi:CRISPR/Cas system-associated endoribonuclease Cas2